MSDNQNLLAGLRILDLSRVLAGPLCTRPFAEFGAEVIKIESAPSGDMVRQFSKLRGERSLYFIQQNLGKKSVCLDLRDPRALQLIKDLVAVSDIVVENFKPGTLDAMGLGYETLKTLKQDIILCSISAMGQTGPLAAKPGYDTIAQGYAGVTAMIGDPNGAPSIPCIAAGDVSTGVHAAFAILAAVYHRDRQGVGQHIDIGLLDVYYNFHEINVHQYSGSAGALNPRRSGSHLGYVCPGGAFKAPDGYMIIMGFAHHWKDMCTAMGREDLVNVERWNSDLKRVAIRGEVIELIETWLAGFASRDAAIAHLEAHGVPVAPVLEVGETLEHPHFKARGTVRTIHDPLAGEFAMPGNPIKFVGREAASPAPAPTLGEHNETVLTELLGRSADEVAALVAAGTLVKKNL
jgi:crotonobetainyl-CoA:carnitine CoA-transferase CaiB-like acyl-CoA transferase